MDHDTIVRSLLGISTPEYEFNPVQDPLPLASTSTSQLQGPLAAAPGSKPPKPLKIPTTHFPSSHFVLGAGSVLFRTHPTTYHLQVCVIHNTRRNTWILPKGRKDQNESMDVTAVRETYEETGYPCGLYPCTMQTRAPPQGGSLKPYVVIELRESVEPFYITVRQLKEGSLKTTWWYITWLKGNDAEKVPGVCMPSEEGYVSSFVDAEEAIEIFKATYFEEIVAKAVQLVQNDFEDYSSSSIGI